MKIIEPGHIYELDQLDMSGKPGDVSQYLKFVNREEGTKHSGTQTQDVIRTLIDRTQHCHNCLPSEHNKHIVYHLRMALAHHEARHLLRVVEKGGRPEDLLIGDDGHFGMSSRPADPLCARRRAKEGEVL